MGAVAIFKGKLVKFLAKAGILIPARPDSGRSISPTAGEMAFNTNANKLEVYTGTSWSQLSAEGTLVHPTTSSTFEYNQSNPGMSGTFNTSIGVNAGIALTTGGGNTFIGANVAPNATSSSANTIVGSSAGTSLVNLAFTNTAIGSSSLSSLVSGSYNTVLGDSAGYNYTSSSSHNTAINSDGPSSPLLLSGTVAIGRDSSGNKAVVLADNQFAFGTSNHLYQLPGVVQGFKIGQTTNNTSYIQLQSDTTGSPVTWTLPVSNGTVGQALTTDGNGVLSWSTVSQTTSSVSFLDNQSTPVNITGFVVPSVLSSKYLVGIYREATTNLYETLEVLIVKRNGAYAISVNGVGDESGVALSITAAGQLQYTSTSVAGHNATNSKIYWKQQVTL